MPVIIQSSSSSTAEQYTFDGTSTDATEISIGSIPVAANTVIMFDCYAVVHGSAVYGSWNIKGMSKNVSGTTSDIGDIYEVVVYTDHDSWMVDLRANDTTDTVDIYVKGTANTSLHWTAYVQVVKQAI